MQVNSGANFVYGGEASANPPEAAVPAALPPAQGGNAEPPPTSSTLTQLAHGLGNPPPATTWESFGPGTPVAPCSCFTDTLPFERVHPQDNRRGDTGATPQARAQVSRIEFDGGYIDTATGMRYFNDGSSGLIADTAERRDFLIQQWLGNDPNAAHLRALGGGSSRT